MSYQRVQSYSSRRQQNWSRNQNTVAYVSAIKLGPVTHTVLIAFMVTILGLIYLTQATRATGYDYEAQKIDNQISQLNTEKSDLEIENARLKALETVKKSSVVATMSKPASTQYTNQ